MTQTLTTATTPQSTACPSVGELLDTVKGEIRTYESRQLGKLKSELEAFDKKRQAAYESYRQRYPALRDKWCALAAEAETLHRTVVCLFKDWQQIAFCCVCENRAAMAQKQAVVDARSTCAWGLLETARNLAKQKADAALAQRDALGDNQKGVEADLATVEKAVAEIKVQLQGPDSARSIHGLFFTVIPTLVRLAPKGTTCLDFASDETPARICTPAQPIPGPVEKASAPPPRAAPWLIHPDDFLHAIDCAWTAYKEANESYATAEASFKATPDDLATLKGELEEARKGLDAKIADCLKKKSPKQSCDCAAEAAGTTGATPTTATPTTPTTPTTVPPSATGTTTPTPGSEPTSPPAPTGCEPTSPPPPRAGCEPTSPPPAGCEPTSPPPPSPPCDPETRPRDAGPGEPHGRMP